eukprot:scaffold185590_cov33-Prasinocladus_malaysianus.AAC.2
MAGVNLSCSQTRPPWPTSAQIRRSIGNDSKQRALHVHMFQIVIIRPVRRLSANTNDCIAIDLYRQSQGKSRCLIQYFVPLLPQQLELFWLQGLLHLIQACFGGVYLRAALSLSASACRDAAAEAAPDSDSCTWQAPQQ